MLSHLRAGALLTGFAALVFTTNCFAQSEPFTIAGHTAEEVFKGPHLANLANAACRGDSDGIRKAIALGADPNGLSVDGGTPLLWAVYCGNPRGTAALLAAGADPNLKARNFYSPTFAASTSSNPSILKELLAHGGDPNTESDRESAIIMAAEYGAAKGRWDNYYSLLNSNADIDRITPVGTVAEWLETLNCFDKVAELLDRGYDQDLVKLGAMTQANLAPDSPQIAWRIRVRTILESKGIKFPIPPFLTIYSGQVWMNGDRSLRVVWFGGRGADGAKIDASSQVLNPDDPAYGDVLKRTGPLRPGYTARIPRSPDDPAPIGKY